MLAWRGRLEEAAAEVPDLIERARHIRDPQILLPALTAASFVEDELGHTEAALDLLAEFEEAAVTAPPWWTTFVFEGLRTLVRAGRLDRAQGLADHVAPFGTRAAGLEISFRAALAEGRGETDEALRLHEWAAARWESFGYVLELGHALLGAGRSLVAQGAGGRRSNPCGAPGRSSERWGPVRLIQEADDLLVEATALSS